jgi:hypothetical protein
VEPLSFFKLVGRASPPVQLFFQVETRSAAAGEKGKGIFSDKDGK